MKLLPICMIRNEEVWMRRILAPLTAVFPLVIVADTGSTDDTRVEIAKVKGVHLVCYPSLSMEEVGLLRGSLQDIAKGMGASHVMLVDGDELYPLEYLRYVYDNPMPDNAPCGFTLGQEIGETSNGELWEIDAWKSRDAVFSVDTKWSGVYPFENHTSFTENIAMNYYWPKDAGHFYHLHGCKRSNRDEDVHLRLSKQHLFDMHKKAEYYSKKLWLKSEKDYRDEALYSPLG